MWGSADGILHRLNGPWALDRRIDAVAAMTGTAVFAPRDDGFISYHEQGCLRLAAGDSFDATRDYLFRALPDGFAVFFAETPLRLFHDIHLRREGDLWLGGASHLCGDDLYDSLYCFLPDGRFTIRHIARGPRKDYCSETMFCQDLR